MRKTKGMWILILCMALVMINLPISSTEVKAKTVKAKSVKLNKSIYTLKKGKTITLKATLAPKNTTQKKLVWTSSNKKIATVSKSGKVKAKKNGKTNITVKIKGTKKTAKCTIYVGLPVTKVTLNAKSKTLTQGQKFQLTAKLSPANPSVKGVTYSTSNKKVATVTANGLVTAVGVGKCSITALSKDGTGKKSVISIVVKKKESSEEVKPGQDPKEDASTETKPDTPPTDLDEEKYKEVTWDNKYVGFNHIGSYYDKNEIKSGVVNLELMGYTENVPDEWLHFPKGTTYKMEDDPNHKYDKIITVTGKSGYTCIYNLTYYYVDITSIALMNNGKDTLLSYDYDEYPPVADGDVNHLMILTGYTGNENLISDLKVTLNRDDAIVKITDNENNTTRKVLSIKVGSVTGKYNIAYTNVVLSGYQSYLNGIGIDEYKATVVKKGNEDVIELALYNSEKEITQELMDKLSTSFTTKGKESMPAEARLMDSDRSDYKKMVQLECNGVTSHLYLKYSIADKYFRLSSLKAMADGENQIISWNTANISNYPEYNIGEKNQILKIEGFVADLPTDITVTTSYDDAVAKVTDSDNNKFSKMITVTYNGETRKYYLLYEFDFDYFMEEHIKSQALVSGEDVITTDYATDRYIDGKTIDILHLEGKTLELPSSFTVTSDVSGVDLVIQNSDNKDYQKMLLVKCGAHSKPYYITYEIDENYVVRSLEFESYKDGKNIITGGVSGWANYFSHMDGPDGDWIYCIDLKGVVATLPDNLTVKSDISFVKPELKESNIDGYEKMLTLSYGSESKNYYITYGFDVKHCIQMKAIWDESTYIDHYSVYSEEVWDDVNKKYVDVNEIRFYADDEFDESVDSVEYEVNVVESEATAEVVDSDISRYKKMLVVTLEGKTFKYYIDIDY